MTKKIFAMFLAVLMVVSMLPTSVFAAGTCPYKGTGLHTAENCDNTVIGEPVAATCNTPGFTAYKCNACGDEFHDNVTPATGAHTWENVGDIEPTCEKEGWKDAKECSVCHKVEGKTRIAPLGEKNGVQVYNCQWEITNPQIDCLTGGEQIWKCVNCGDEKTVKIDKKAAHAWGDFQLITAATATTNGKAERVCKDCGAKDEVVVYYAHECENHLITITGYPMTCTTDGLKDHQECRICGKKFDMDGKALKDSDVKKLVIAAKHTYECPLNCPLKDTDHKQQDGSTIHVATCVDTVLHCKVCDQTLAPNVEHTYSTNYEEKKDPTCVASGWKTYKCTSCKLAIKTEILPALNHKTVEVEVPATCVSIGYTFTYCTRIGCKDCIATQGTVTDKNGLNYSVQMDGFSPIESLPTFEKAEDRVLGGFYLALEQTKAETVLYFTGKMDGNFLATSNDVREAVQVYLERVHVGLSNQYYLFFYNAEGAKTYIDLEAYEKTSNSGSKYAAAAVKLTTETPKAIFTWDDTYEVLVSKEMVYNAAGAKDSFFLGTYNKYETISASNDSYLSQGGQFLAKLCEVGAKKDVQLTAKPTFNYDAGFNASNHAHNLTQTVLVPAECEVKGAGEYRCSACGWSEPFEIPAGHDFVAQTTGKVNNEDAYKAPTCVPGYIYKVCTCGEFQKVVLAGYGHVMGTEQNPVLNHETTSGYKHTDCTIEGCDYSIKGAYMVWEGVGKVYDSWTAAAAAHNNKLSADGTVIVKGDCSTAKRTQYKCECGVWVVVEETGYGYGKHLDMLTDGQYKAPDCVNAGGFYTFYCDGCKAYVGSAPYSETPGEANWNPEAALGHDFQVARGHECAGCDNPDYDDVHKTCKRDGCTVTVPCYKELKTVTVSSGNDLCDTTVMEYYWCEKCQDEHIRNFVKALDHEWKPVLNDKGEINYTKKPSCTEEGTYTEKCAVCGDTREAVAPIVAHKNKAGELFFNKCTDTIADRHCVVCCACTSKGASHDCTKFDTNSSKPGVQPCACVIPADHQWDTVLMPSNCSMAPYWAKSCPDCGARENEVVTEYVFDVTVGAEEIVHMGHKPAEIDYVQATKDGKLVFDKDGKPVMEAKKYPGFTYEEYTYVWYTVVEGKLVKNTETYTAKFIERKAASYIEEGYDLFVCQICNSEEKNVKAKLSGLGFEFSVENALGGNEFTYGSLIEVVVSVNGNNAAVHGFNFNVSVANAVAGAKFVGYEKLNEDFNLVVLKPENTGSKATISGFAANDASGKQQNITINGKTELVKLFFRLADKAFVDASSLTAKFEPVPNQPAVTVLKDGNSVDVTANTNILNKDFATRGFLNFNNDTAANTKDLQMAMSMITLEHVDGKTYDVTVDVNKDGVVDLQDLSIAYNYVVGNYDLVDLLVMGISAEEIVLLDLNEKVLCNNPNCQYELDADWNRCPICGNYQ